MSDEVKQAQEERDTGTPKTSSLRVRPFIPCMKDEEKDGREEFATLTYGNVTVELDYTILRNIRLYDQSPYMAKTVSIFHAAVREIVREMHVVMDGRIPDHHREPSERNGFLSRPGSMTDSSATRRASY